MKFSIYVSILLSGIILMLSCNNEDGPGPKDCTNDPVQISEIKSTESICGVNDGTISITALGGTGIYLFSIDGKSFQKSNTFENLMAGNYTITVQDEMECMVSAQATVVSSTGMEVGTAIESSGCNSSDGSVQINPSGGMEPYTYKLDNGNYQTDPVFTNLPGGEYVVFVKDNNDCEISSTVRITFGTSLETDVMPLLESNCAISDCHDGGNNLPDWKVKGNVISYAGVIKQRTENGSMPPMGSTITDAEINTIACWVDDGAQDN